LQLGGSSVAFDRDPFLEAHSRYQGYRDAAFDQTWDELHKVVPTGCDLRVMPIDESALSFWHAIRHFKAVHAAGGFPWDEIFRQVRSTPRRFDVAIWDGDILCGMAVGMASKGNHFVTVKWIERFETRPDNLAGMIAEIALTAAEHYARVLGKQHVRIKNPLPGTERLYQALRFSLVPSAKKTIYWERPVD